MIWSMRVLGKKRKYEEVQLGVDRISGRTKRASWFISASWCSSCLFLFPFHDFLCPSYIPFLASNVSDQHGPSGPSYLPGSGFRKALTKPWPLSLSSPGVP
jgi:hypothetical protein